MKRTIPAIIICSLLLGTGCTPPDLGIAEPIPEWFDDADRPLPNWYDNAKFGIMIHWGLYSVPAWAEKTLDPEIWVDPVKLLLQGHVYYQKNPYAEWYANTINVNGSEAQQHHLNTYGPDFSYADFMPLFEQQSASWTPESWAELFSEAGAKYVVLVTKHHDGYTLWPSAVEHPLRADWSSTRNFVGELTTAVRDQNMRMGLYYSGGIDWSFDTGTIANLFGFIMSMPSEHGYAAYADAHWRELIEQYQPSVLWNDIKYPNAAGKYELFAHYYDTVPDGVINDRWNLVPATGHYDYKTAEYQPIATLSEEKFETIRGMGRSFGFNQIEGVDDYLSAEELIHQLIDIVSKNGNFLLNVGPMADGTIPSEQVDRLQAIGLWLGTSSEAIFGTKPWIRAEGSTSGGTPVRFTQDIENNVLYSMILGPVMGGEVVIEELPQMPVNVELLGFPATLTWFIENGSLRIVLPDNYPERAAYAFAISGVN